MSKAVQELKEKIILNDELLKCRKQFCVDEEYETCKSLYDEGKALPEGVFHGSVISEGGVKEDVFYRYGQEKMSDEEWKQYIALKQYMDIRTIKRCVVFFAVLAIISLVLSIIAGINISSLLS